jgi:hypothetical protein
MGTGHSRHSKRPDHGSSSSHVNGELRDALMSLRLVKKSLARAETRLRQIPPDVMKKNAWCWELSAPIETALRQAATLKVSIDQALAAEPHENKEERKTCVCAHPRELHADEKGICGSCSCIVYSEPSINGLRCSTCGAHQFHDALGMTCSNGHRDATPIRCPDVKLGERDCGNDECAVCYQAFVTRNTREAVESALREQSQKNPDKRGGRVPKNF